MCTKRPYYSEWRSRYKLQLLVRLEQHYQSQEIFSDSIRHVMWEDPGKKGEGKGARPRRQGWPTHSQAEKLASLLSPHPNAVATSVS